MIVFETTINELRNLFELQGKEAYYGEQITQFSHAAQACQLAMDDGYSVEVQIAAFLHDIGHLLPVISQDEKMSEYGRKNHEALAAEWLLQRGFSIQIATLVEQHVNAKRYLCFKNPDYYTALSEASQQTLAFQGGAMLEAEAVNFEENPYFDTIIQMRKWDEAAKEPDAMIPNLEYFLDLCLSFLKSQNQDRHL